MTSDCCRSKPAVVAPVVAVAVAAAAEAVVGTVNFEWAVADKVGIHSDSRGSRGGSQALAVWAVRIDEEAEVAVHCCSSAAAAYRRQSLADRMQVVVDIACAVEVIGPHMVREDAVGSMASIDEVEECASDLVGTLVAHKRKVVFGTDQAGLARVCSLANS